MLENTEMSYEKHFIIDFDSTFTSVEALDILGEIALREHPEKDKRLKAISDITNRGMEGGMSLRESLIERLKQLNAHKDHLPLLIHELSGKVSKSFRRNKDFIKNYASRIYIVSNGFKDFIVPIVTQYGVLEKNVFANTFIFDDEGKITGFDEDNVLSSNKGKVKIIQKLQLQGDVCVIGDGYTDYEIKEAGLANKFYAFTENIERDKILKNADHVVPSLDEFLYLHKMNKALSYPKNRIKVLLLENIHSLAYEKMKEEGYTVETIAGGLDEEELCEKIKGVSILGIRSKTQVTRKVIESANRLISIGAFCIGTNQIDLTACSEKGIAVFNAPFSNTRSVVELALGEIIMLLRNIPTRSNQMHAGVWQKSASNSYEVRGKKLGIVGYGNIGSQLSVLAETVGLDVHYYDIEEKLALGNATKCSSLQELMEISDIVSLHIDGRPENTRFIGERELSWMKKGAIFINLARGPVLRVDALRKLLDNGHLAGAAVDVFPEEPKTNEEEFISVLRGADNTILTPHIGGSTQEAQVNIADFVPNKIMQYINTGSTTNSVNFPNLQLPAFKDSHRLIHVHKNVPGILARINNILAEHQINIEGQYLKTNETIGYVITDINKEYDEELIKTLKSVEHTIKFRVLY